MSTIQTPRYTMGSDEWREERRKTVGCSEIAAILGINPWKSAFAIYQEKRGEVSSNIESDVLTWGKQMELSLRQAYSDLTGRAVRVPETIIINPKFPFIGASLDGLADDRVVEIKTSRNSAGWGAAGTGDIPEYYQTQVQGYLAVTELPVADVIVSISGAPPVIYEVPEDKELQQMIIDACRDFWQRVVDGNPPDITTFADATARFGKSSASGQVYASNETIAQVAELKILKEELKAMETREEELKAKIIIALGEKGDALVGTEKQTLVTYKLAAGRKTLDSKSLEKEEPMVYARFLKVGAPSRRFLIK